MEYCDGNYLDDGDEFAYDPRPYTTQIIWKVICMQGGCFKLKKDFLERSQKLNFPPYNILANLKKELPDNVSTIKDIYNALIGIKDNETGLVGSTSIQVMLLLLHDTNYIFDFTMNDVFNRLENFFSLYTQHY